MNHRIFTNAGWAVSTLWLCIVIAASMQSTRSEADALHVIQQDALSAQLDGLAGVPVSAEVHTVIGWILQSHDHQDLPFAVVDKIHAHVFIFNNAGDFLGDAPVLLGLALGDDGVTGIGDRALSRIRPKERITPSGRFIANLARNIMDEEILWVDYEQSISMHALRNVNPKEQRLQRLTSPTVLDNRISYGCINVPTAFWRDIVVPAFTDSPGVVYVLPEVRSVQTEFAFPTERRR